MSVYDVMRSCINGAWSDDACDYDTYDELHTFIADAEYEYEKLEADNEKLREFASWLVEYVDPAGYQGICNIECPASARCRGKSTCSFPDWAIERAKELGIEVY